MSKNKKLMILYLGGLFAIVCIIVGLAVLGKHDILDHDHITDGVKIGTVDVSGMTQNQADQAVQDYVKKQQNKEITLVAGRHQVTVTGAAIGVQYATKGMVARAMNIGKQGSLFKRMKQIDRAAQGKENLELRATMDEQTASRYLKENVSIYNRKEKKSRLVFKNGSLVATKSRVGMKLQVDETIKQVFETFQNQPEADAITVNCVVREKQPAFTQAQIRECRDVLGTFTTSYATYLTARCTNLQVAAGYINGTMLMPGETFSTVEVIKDRTEANGYKAASEYAQGKVVEGVGGGVCQVATTLYNAVINAELEVVERAPHSMKVSYVPVSRDAAIAGDYKDLKFKNNLSYPVFIFGSAEGGYIHFTIYGKDERDENRTISFEPEIIKTIEPGKDVVTKDNTLPKGYQEVTQEAHTGYEAKLWKIVSVDGVQTDKILLNTSYYAAAPRYVTKGTKKKEKAAEEEDTKEDSEDDSKREDEQ